MFLASKLMKGSKFSCHFMTKIEQKAQIVIYGRFIHDFNSVNVQYSMLFDEKSEL